MDLAQLLAARAALPGVHSRGSPSHPCSSRRILPSSAWSLSAMRSSKGLPWLYLARSGALLADALRRGAGGRL